MPDEKKIYDMTELACMNQKEMAEWVAGKGYPEFRGKQLFRWIHQGADFSEMTNLPREMRDDLSRTATARSVSVITSRRSALDGTVKFLFGLMDGNCVEGVLMKYHFGYSLCISTQVGCRMGCRFCASTLDGCVRNLSAGEMLCQILEANRFLAPEGGRVSHVVLMGSGEPFDNYSNVVRFLRLLREEDGVRISLRNVSLSTCGIIPGILDFSKEGLPVTLCISLHAPNDSVRAKLMPVAKLYPVHDILDACRKYIRATGRRIIFEYALTDGINSDNECAVELCRLLRGMQCHVNLIPLNDVAERNLRGVSENTVQSFMKTLKDGNISVTRRREMGDDIDGACGQLRRAFISNRNGEKNEQKVLSN